MKPVPYSLPSLPLSPFFDVFKDTGGIVSEECDPQSPVSNMSLKM